MSASPPTPVRLVRHGEVAAAHRGTFYGGAEVPLSESGLRASRELVRELLRDPPELVACSPLGRALAVAEPLAQALDRPCLVDEGFRELDRGHWTHLHRDEIEASTPGAIARYLADPEGCAAPGGESESAFTTRVWQATDRLLTQAAGCSVVLVSHGHVIRAILRRVLGWSAVQSLRHFVPYHAVVHTELQPGGGGRLLSAPESVLPEALR